MRFLIYTHAFIWYMEGNNKLSPKTIEITTNETQSPFPFILHLHQCLVALFPWLKTDFE